MSEATQLLAQCKQHGPRLAGPAIHYNKEGHLCFGHPGLLQEAPVNVLQNFWRIGCVLRATLTPRVIFGGSRAYGGLRIADND
jgi:hypothetical protein